MSGISILSDTNPLIYLLNGNKDIAEYLDGKQVWISAITELELFGKKVKMAAVSNQSLKF